MKNMTYLWKLQRLLDRVRKANRTAEWCLPGMAFLTTGMLLMVATVGLAQRGVNYDESKVPAYTLPANAEDLAVLRIVVREGFSRDLAGLLLADLQKAVSELEEHPPHEPKAPTPQFKH